MTSGDSRLPVRIAVIGCGAAFENLYVSPLQRLQKRGAVRVVGLIDPDGRRREWAGRRFPGARVGGELLETLGTVKPELTLVTSPPRLHSEHCLEALKSGSHVLCEKPLSDRVEEGLRIAEGAARFGRLVGVEMPRRYYPNSAEARDVILRGGLGKVVSYSYREGSIYTWPVVSESAFKREVVGGGVLQDKGPHVLDLLDWTFGPGEVLECEDDAWHGGVEANSRIQLRHGGVRGTLQLSWDQELNNGFHVRGTTSELLVPLGPVDFYFLRKPGEVWRRVETSVRWATRVERDQPEAQMPRDAYAGIELQIIHFIRAMLHGEPVPVSVDDGLRTLSLIRTAYERARPLAQPWLSVAEQEVQAERHWRTARA